MCIRDSISRVIQGLDNPKIDVQFLNQHQLLLLAVKQGSLENVQLLLAEGVDPNFSEVSKELPLILAIEKNQPQITLSLLRAGANPYLRDSNGLAPEEAAKKVNNTFAIDALEAAYKKDINAR